MHKVLERLHILCKPERFLRELGVCVCVGGWYRTRTKMVSFWVKHNAGGQQPRSKCLVVGAKSSQLCMSFYIRIISYLNLYILRGPLASLDGISVNLAELFLKLQGLFLNVFRTIPKICIYIYIYPNMTYNFISLNEIPYTLRYDHIRLRPFFCPTAHGKSHSVHTVARSQNEPTISNLRDL